MERMQDTQFENAQYILSESEHLYGDKVHLLSNPRVLSLLSKFSSPKVTMPLLNNYLELLYRELLTGVVNTCFDKKFIEEDTRMALIHEQHGVFKGVVIDEYQKVVTVDLARAGILPSQFCFNELNLLLSPECVRQDHFYINRKVNQKNEVIGVDYSGSKIGGDIDEAIVLLPDPMGATGESLCYAIDHYKADVEGIAKKIVAMHLIITPEYIKKMQQVHPDVEIFALRLDRGFSSERALNSLPGTWPLEEKGLNKNHYIVPGAGGIGEVLNNSFV